MCNPVSHRCIHLFFHQEPSRKDLQQPCSGPLKVCNRGKRFFPRLQRTQRDWLTLVITPKKHRHSRHLQVWSKNKSHHTLLIACRRNVKQPHAWVDLHINQSIFAWWTPLLSEPNRHWPFLIIVFMMPLIYDVHNNDSFILVIPEANNL